MNLVNYPMIQSKIKAMYAKNLTKEDLEEMLKQKDIKDVVYILKSKIEALENLNQEANRIEIEENLSQIIIHEIRKVDKLLDEKSKEILYSYIEKYKLEELKNIWYSLELEKEYLVPKWLAKIDKRLRKIPEVKTKQEFLEKIKYDKEVYKIFEKSKTKFELENKLDKYYFIQLIEKTKENKQLNKIIKTQVDLLNILWTYRLSKYKISNKQEYLIPYTYKLTKETTQKLIRNAYTIEDFIQILKDTKYSGIIKGDIEIDFKRFIFNQYKKQLYKNNLNVLIVIAYIAIQENISEDIIKIIEAVRYKINPKETKDLLITM